MAIHAVMVSAAITKHQGHDPGMAGLDLVRVLFLVCRWGLLIVSAHGLYYVYGEREREREREREQCPLVL
jgi:hypothetical protein